MKHFSELNFPRTEGGLKALQISARDFKAHSVNRRAAFAMRCTGGDLGDQKTFCGVMALPSPVRKSSHSKRSK